MSNEHNNAPAVPDTHISVQEAWEAAGGNPGIKASKADLIIALKTLDTVCDEADAAPAVPQGAIGWIPKWAFARLTGELGGKADPVTWGLHAPIYAKEPGAGDGVAIYATPAPAPTPAQEQCNACLGTGRMVRDPDIGTDQECFVCDGAGYEPAQEVGLTDAAGLSMLIAGALFDFGGYLTTHPDVIDVGSTALAGPVADRIKAFAAMRGLSLDDAAVLSWSEGIAALRAKEDKHA